MNPTNNYESFLQSKALQVPPSGFEVSTDSLNPKLFEFQRYVVSWALRRGKAAIFAECGLGKTAQQLEWANQVCLHTLGDVLILAPLAVAAQTKREAQKFGIEATICRNQSDIRPGINITNYEMLQHFDPSRFIGVVLDESGILKSYMGATKQKLLQSFCNTPYRLACTATPAPNDHMELGNHAEFLGVMPSNEMLARWFINDTEHFGTYRVKGHAAKDFWEWVASWAMCLSKPSDIGFPDDGFNLPQLHTKEHCVDVDLSDGASGALFRTVDLSATGLHKEMRLTTDARAQVAADLAHSDKESWIIWCNTNYESEAIAKLIPEAVEVRGSDSNEKKERSLTGFANGDIRVLVSKASICGYGLNWQFCARAAFVGLSYSFEQYYQAVRRIWRFGQERDVYSHIIMASTEADIVRAVQRKQAAHLSMQNNMADAISRVHRLNNQQRQLRVDAGQRKPAVPSWLQVA